MPEPIVSMLMSVYNGERYVREAVGSVLAQTFAGFEFVVVDDGSTDATPEILSGYRDPRMRVLRRPHDGLIASLNAGLAAARGRYVARQDADDVSFPRRLAVQVARLEARPAVGLVGSDCVFIDAAGRRRGRSRLETDDLRLRWLLLFSNQFVHTSVVFRRDLALAVGGYAGDDLHAEDYGLWSRIASVARVANCRTPLVAYRQTATGITATSGDTMWDAVLRITTANLRDAAGRGTDPAVIRYLASLAWPARFAGLERGPRRRRELAAVRSFIDDLVGRFCAREGLAGWRATRFRRWAAAAVGRMLFGQLIHQVRVARRPAPLGPLETARAVAAALGDVAAVDPLVYLSTRWLRPFGRAALDLARAPAPGRRL